MAENIFLSAGWKYDMGKSLGASGSSLFHTKKSTYTQVYTVYDNVALFYTVQEYITKTF